MLRTLIRYYIIDPDRDYVRFLKNIVRKDTVQKDLIVLVPTKLKKICPLDLTLERKTDETPFWRTLKNDGELNEKYPEGIDGQKLRLEMEGHTIIQKGKRYFVKDYKDKLFEINY